MCSLKETFPDVSNALSEKGTERSPKHPKVTRATGSWKKRGNMHIREIYILKHEMKDPLLSLRPQKDLTKRCWIGTKLAGDP
jgi:hypothetical protein